MEWDQQRQHQVEINQNVISLSYWISLCFCHESPSFLSTNEGIFLWYKIDRYIQKCSHEQKYCQVAKTENNFLQLLRIFNNHLEEMVEGLAHIKWNWKVKRVDYKVDNMEGYAQWSLTRSCETVNPNIFLVVWLVTKVLHFQIAITFCPFGEKLNIVAGSLSKITRLPRNADPSVSQWADAQRSVSKCFESAEKLFSTKLFCLRYFINLMRFHQGDLLHLLLSLGRLGVGPSH